MSLSADIASALIDGNVLLQAEPGAGKSTALPLALLQNSQHAGKILLLEPRRLAARMVASRLASHLGEQVGQRVGLRMRAETRVSAATQIEVVTEGVLTRILQQDPGLEGVALIIFDEFHERSLHADLGLALCLEVQRELREDLRLLLMSATLQSEQLGAHLKQVATFQCAVRQHPVEPVWMGDSSEPLPQRIVQAVLSALNEQTGDILVFLPGVAEIRRCSEQLLPRLSAGVSLHQLHSGVGSVAQTKATAPASASGRRIILATSLAETSITIEGVRAVVDSGLERRGKLDSVTGSQRLETVTASQASATQRAGRAGRTAAGVCYRLWSQASHARRSSHWQPEIRRADLSPLLMETGTWGASDANALPWLEPPPAASLSRAAALLSRLGLWQEGQLTEQGRLVATLPVHPRLGHMLVWAGLYGQASLACRLAVLLEDNSRHVGGVDLEPGLGRALSAALSQRAGQLERRVTTVSNHKRVPVAASTNAQGSGSASASGNTSTSAGKNALAQLSTSIPSSAVVLSQAYPDWIARRRPGSAGKYLLACGAGVVIDTQDSLANCEWLAVAQLGGTGTQLRIFKALSLDIDELESFSTGLFDTVDHLGWDDNQQRVLAERRLMIGGILVSSQIITDISDTDTASALLSGIRKNGLDCLPWNDECREWQARMLRMREMSSDPESDDWPRVDDEALLASLEEWLLPWLTGIRSMKSLQRLNLYDVLKALLSYHQQQQLEQWFPVRYQVPSGSRIRLSYLQPGNPVLSVRLQEMLGCAVNPSIAQGSIVLKVELLSPAHRPVQVTTDLVNFWSSSYPAVKKDMAGRYPKHFWPDDPLSATPTTHAKRRK